MASSTDTEAIAGLVTAIGQLPLYTTLAVGGLAALGLYTYWSKLHKRSTEGALLDANDAQAAALIRIVEGMVEEGHKATMGQHAAVARLTEAVVDLRLAVAGQTALLGNLTQAVQNVSAQVSRANDKCLSCTRNNQNTKID